MDETVVHEDIGGANALSGAQSEKAGIARAGADQNHFSMLVFARGRGSSSRFGFKRLDYERHSRFSSQPQI
jgi:hypothetical protein